MSTEQEFKPGDLVSLKSAGVACTFLYIIGSTTDDNPYGMIGYFDQNKTYNEAAVPLVALKHLDTDKDYQAMITIQSINLELQLKQATQAKQDALGLVSRQAGVKGPRVPIKN
jgi:hypothetical protein